MKIEPKELSKEVLIELVDGILKEGFFDKKELFFIYRHDLILQIKAIKTDIDAIENNLSKNLPGNKIQALVIEYNRLSKLCNNKINLCRKVNNYMATQKIGL